jgi:hypothetical protein
MDDQERTYFVEHIKDLEQSRSRWRLMALVSLVVLVLAILLQGGVNLLQGYRAFAHRREALLREVEARAFVEQQRREAEAQKPQVDSKKQK